VPIALHSEHRESRIAGTIEGGHNADVLLR